MGRPEVTSHDAIEQAAFRLFAERGFGATTLEDIAAEVGVGRRTLFRYFPSKNDIAWGRFDETLEAFRELLEAIPDHVPVLEAVGRGVVEFNRFPTDASPPHVERMRLLLTTPALQAHSALRYAEWRQVVADDAARRLGRATHELEPQLVGRVALAVALTAYEIWLQDPDASLLDLLIDGLSALALRPVSRPGA